jgi:hypothetical protein
MGTVTYKRLFNTRIVHDFYVDYFSRNDLAVVPTIETEQAMKSSGMQFRRDDVGFRILYRIDDSSNAFISFKNIGLVFALTLRNAGGFLNFTDLDDNTNPYQSGKIIYFTNRTNVTANDLEYDLLDYLKSKIFSYQFPQTASGNTDMGHIKITNQDNVDVTSQLPSPAVVAPDTMNRYFYAADFTKLPAGLYTFETWTDIVPTPTSKKKIYIDNNLARQGIFGIVDILATDDNPANYPAIPAGPVVPPITDPAVYNMNFIRRTSRWRYIVVYKSGNINTGNDSQLAITDTTIQPPYNPSAVPINFVRQPGYINVSGYDASQWLSDLPPLPFFETAKSGIDLMNGASTMISDVAGAGIDLQSGTAAETEIFLYI